MTRQDDFTVAIDMDKVLTRLLYRRDAWGLPYGWDVPRCMPEVQLTADADEHRERSGALLARLWERAGAESWSTVQLIPDVSPVELRALGVTPDAPDGPAMREWLAARLGEVQRLSTKGLRSDPGWCLWEALACAGKKSPTSVVVLPVAGDWMHQHGDRLLVSLELYADPERFVDAAMAR